MPRMLFRACCLGFILAVHMSYSQQKASALLAVIQSPQADSVRILAMTEVGYLYWATKDDSAFLLAQQAEKLSRKINFGKGIGRAYWLQGIHYYNLGQNRKAILLYDSALVYARRAADQLGIGRVYNGLGQYNADVGDFEKALKYHFQSLKIKETLGDKTGIAVSYNNIGNIYFRIGNTDKALEYCFKGLAMREALDERDKIASSENNIAQIYDKMGQRDKALSYFNSALKGFRETGTLRGITYTCNDLAKFYMKEKKYADAYRYLKEGLETAEIMKSTERMADLNVTFAMYQNKMGNYQEAAHHAHTAIKLAKEAGLLEYARSAVKEMATSAFMAKEFRHAYLAEIRFSQLSDSIQKKAKIERALQEEYKFNAEKTKAEQDQKELHYQSLTEKQQWMLYAALAVLTGVAIVAYALYRSARIKKDAGDLLRIQRNELASKNSVIETQNRLLQEAKNQLEQNIELRTHDLKLANQELVNQNLQLEQFTFMTAHNLRGPVARLIGLGSLYDTQNPAEPFNTEVIRRIKQSSSDLDEVIRDMTAILRTKSGIADNFSQLSIRDMASKVLLQLEQDIKDKNIAIVNDLDEPFAISGIPAYVQSIFYNILSNSIKYCESFGSKIRISAAYAQHHIKVCFEDNGVGFDAEANRDKLFRPFTRFSTVKEGKGLGLYQIKVQMESMRGCVEIESRKNEGTKVTLTFPNTI
jgi:signal transduction histidine kinase